MSYIFLQSQWVDTKKWFMAGKMRNLRFISNITLWEHSFDCFSFQPRSLKIKTKYCEILKEWLLPRENARIEYLSFMKGWWDRNLKIVRSSNFLRPCSKPISPANYLASPILASSLRKMRIITVFISWSCWEDHNKLNTIQEHKPVTGA